MVDISYDKDIKDLFDRIAKHFENSDEGTKAMFSMLVRVALKYRDDLVIAKASPLTVGETRVALDAFMEVLKTKKFAKKVGKRELDLVILWLEELKTMKQN